jgi:cyclophilin family peptidyl-prolyl cis-trans isomerase
MAGNQKIIISAETARFCYLDIDIDNSRQKLATAAAFVHATDSRYGLSSKDLRELGGSEVNRLSELVQTDHEWSSRASDICVRPPTYGSRIVVKLDWETAPLACENFATLCANGSPLKGDDKKVASAPPPIGTSGKPLTYRRTTIHRVVPSFVMQGGDMVMGNGSGGESIWGKKFKDERGGLLLKHSERGILSMGNSGKNSNSSQWFITFDSAPQCDGKHVIFGKVVSGWDVIAAVESYGQVSSGKPSVAISVTDCGLWIPTETPGDGYWFDKTDPETYCGVTPIFCVRPRVALVVPSKSVMEKFQKELSSFCYLLNVEVDDGTNETSATEQLKHLLDEYAIDVVLVAPACTVLLDAFRVTWAGMSSTKVIMESKPIEAASAVKIRSWIAETGWFL